MSDDVLRRRKADRNRVTYALKNGTGLMMQRLSLAALAVLMPVVGYLLNDTFQTVRSEIRDVGADVKDLKTTTFGRMKELRQTDEGLRVDVTRLQEQESNTIAAVQDLRGAGRHR